MTFACGTCGISMLSSAFPPFEVWSYLLLPALIFYICIQINEGEPVLGTILGSCGKAAALFMAGIAFLAGIIWPALILAAFVFFLKRVFRENRVNKYLSLSILGLFAVSGVHQFAQAKYQGDYWQLTRLKAGGPAYSYFHSTAENKVFSDDQLSEYIHSEDKNVARNSREILKKRIQLIDSSEELSDLEHALEPALQKEKDQNLRDLLGARKSELQEPEESE